MLTFCFPIRYCTDSPKPPTQTFVDSLQQTADETFSALSGVRASIDNGFSAHADVEVAEEPSSPALPNQLTVIESIMMLEGTISQVVLPEDSISEWENVEKARLLSLLPSLNVDTPLVGLELQVSFTEQAVVDAEEEVAASLQVMFVVELEFQSESTMLLPNKKACCL